MIIYYFLIFCLPTTIKWGWQYIIFIYFAKSKQGMMSYSISLSHKKNLFHVTLKFIYLSNISCPSCSGHHVSLVMSGNVRKLWCLQISFVIFLFFWVLEVLSKVMKAKKNHESNYYVYHLRAYQRHCFGSCSVVVKTREFPETCRVNLWTPQVIA